MGVFPVSLKAIAEARLPDRLVPQQEQTAVRQGQKWAKQQCAAAATVTSSKKKKTKNGKKKKAVRANLCDLGLDKGFLDVTSKVQSTKVKTVELDFIEIKNLSVLKESINKVKRQPTKWEKIFKSYT